jgi:transcriptional antiterminator RfaH
MIVSSLSQELSCYPNDLLCSDSETSGYFNDSDFMEPIDGEERKWGFVYTKARQEKALARDLYTQGIPYYLPLVHRDSVVRGRRLRSYIPLFSGYLFLYSSPAERYRCLDTRRVSSIVNVSNPSQLRQELRQVQRLIEADVPLTVERRLEVGQRVRVRTGPFSGIEGSLVRAGDVPKLLVAIQYLGQGITLEIEGFKVDPVY